MAWRLMAGHTADAEDVVQETWQRAATRLRGFEWNAALATWLTSILINCTRERRRARPLVRADPAHLSLAPAPIRQPDPVIDLERAIAALPAGYRDVLILHDVEGYTHDEIAALLGIATGTSKSQLFHARRAMRAKLTLPAPEDINHAG